MKKTKIKKHIFVTGMLVVYALFMTLYFGLDLLREGQGLRFWCTLIGEAAVITLTFFALRKRDRYREMRREEMKGL